MIKLAYITCLLSDLALDLFQVDRLQNSFLDQESRCLILVFRFSQVA